MTPFIGETLRNWHRDRAPRMGAALAYYITLSLAPTLVIVLAIAGLAFGAKAAQGRLVWQIQGLVGHEGAKVIQALIDGTRAPYSGMLATLIGLATLFFGGTAAVTELRDALNTIWQIPDDVQASHARNLFNVIKERFQAFALVLVAGVVLLLSVILHAWISAAVKYFRLAGTAPPVLIHSFDWSVSFALLTLLFASIFKFLPAVDLKWQDVAAGAVVTSILFTAGKFFLGVYLTEAGFAENYGAAGSLVMLLVWVYYSAQVVFLGAEFTQVYAIRFGSLAIEKTSPL
uniref:Ribonuclease BN n=1 Tax=Solibacter usitatus (strain Ellin6076) TaxID=234267 RepID=Q022Z6_SOLUE